MKPFKPGLFLLPLLATLSACTVAPEIVQDESCHSSTVLLDAYFEAGNLGKCRVAEDGSFELTLHPEDAPPINPSPWYAFRASGQAGETVDIRLNFAHGYARYWPKTSPDARHWTALPAAAVRKGDGDDKWMEFEFELEQGLTWVAGQEILAGDYYNDWVNELESHPAIETRLLGASEQGRPIFLAQTADRPEMILMIGRQHPPEVTGAIAMRSFIRTVLADTKLAQRFRQRFKLAIVPLLNPDGVAAGHWRHNVNGVDINRDWGPFTQPETRAVNHWLTDNEAEGKTLRLMLDFHSTFEDLFYTQPISENPPDFASLWLSASAKRLPEFAFKHAANPVSEQPNAKNYFYVSRGIPAITYESGDETDRHILREAAVVFAEEMMKLMLSDPPPESATSEHVGDPLSLMRRNPAIPLPSTADLARSQALPLSKKQTRH